MLLMEDDVVDALSRRWTEAREQGKVLMEASGLGVVFHLSVELSLYQMRIIRDAWHRLYQSSYACEIKSI